MRHTLCLLALLGLGLLATLGCAEGDVVPTEKSGQEVCEDARQCVHDNCTQEDVDGGQEKCANDCLAEYEGAEVVYPENGMQDAGGYGVSLAWCELSTICDAVGATCGPF